MNPKQMRALSNRSTDVKGAIHRLCDSEALYSQCLRSFISDTTMRQLSRAVDEGSWDDAFTYAHALKGLAGNLGFVPLMHSTGQLVVLIRGGRTREISDEMERLGSCYRDIVDAIEQYFAYEDKGNGESI